MSRQACQLICVLSQAMGSHFDSLAVHFIPALFKVLVITVQVWWPGSTFMHHSTSLPKCHYRVCNCHWAQAFLAPFQQSSRRVGSMHYIRMMTAVWVQVMADAAHECIRAIVTNSHSWRIVQRISDAVCKDRSPKLRLCCAEYLAQVSPGGCFP